jgi:hypothetical protein
VLQLAAENALGHGLDREVEERREGESQADGARHRALGLAYLSARHERHLDAGESEDQQQHRAAERLAAGPAGPREVARLDGEDAHADEERERQQLGDRDPLDEPRPRLDPADVHECE